MAKQYKNVYTILEKVKKGEIRSYYKEKDGLFGKINFYKKPDLITPNLHYLDENRLRIMMEQHLADGNSVLPYFNKLVQYQEFKNIPTDKKPSFEKFHHDLRVKSQKFPEHILRDIFKMYYNRIEKLKFEERNEKNFVKYKFLEKANNPIGKIMSEGSSLKSAIFARNVYTYLLTRLTALEYMDQDSSKDVSKSMENGSEFSNQDVEQALDKLLESKCAKSMLEEAVQRAQDLCQQMDQFLPEDLQETMFENIDESKDGQDAGKLSASYIQNIAQRLESIKLSMGSLKEKIKKLLDKSVNYFSSSTKTEFENILDSDNIGGIDDYIELHPTLRKIFIEDVMVKDTKPVGKIDLYIDISGSMSGTCGAVNDKGNPITKMEFCKSFAAKLEQMQMLNDVYIFDTVVKKYKKDPISIAFLNANGGTKIDNVIYSIEKNQTNALVITDAEDNCRNYSDKAFFIGVEGAMFNHFYKPTLKQYVDRAQIVIFDGQRILNVDCNGNILAK